jgi:hypothetical protein
MVEMNNINKCLLVEPFQRSNGLRLSARCIAGPKCIARVSKADSLSFQRPPPLYGDGRFRNESESATPK